MLEYVVQNGAKNGIVAGYRVGGKTGTSQKMIKLVGSDEEKYIASYLSIAPVDEPEIAVLVMIDEPSAGQYYGSAVSAPIGAEILTEILPYLGYEPQYTEEELASLSISVPSVVGNTVSVAKGKITNSKLTYKVVGNGENVIKQIPAATESLHAGGTVIIYTDGQEGATETTTVPEFNGLSVSASNATAKNAGLNIQFAGNTSGSVIAYKQSIASGSSVEKGSVITVYFRDTRADAVAD